MMSLAGQAYINSFEPETRKSKRPLLFLSFTGKPNELLRFVLVRVDVILP